jgi:hypothetical protein
VDYVGSAEAEENLKRFIAWATKLGIHEEHLFSVSDVEQVQPMVTCACDSEDRAELSRLIHPK